MKAYLKANVHIWLPPIVFLWLLTGFIVLSMMHAPVPASTFQVMAT